MVLYVHVPLWPCVALLSLLFWLRYCLLLWAQDRGGKQKDSCVALCMLAKDLKGESILDKYLKAESMMTKGSKLFALRVKVDDMSLSKMTMQSFYYLKDVFL